MSKKIISVILTVLLMLSITVATVMAKNTPDVFSVIDNLTTTENLLTVRNLTHRPDPGKLFLSGKNLMGIVIFELKKENVDSVSFLAQIHEDKEYKINLYASNRNDKWADAPLIECVTQFEYNEGTYDYYTYTTKSLPEDTKFIKIEIPAIPESYTDVQLHEISYTYNDGLNIKDNDVFFAGEVNLTATTNDLVTALSFYSAGEELCGATKADGVWKGTWNAAEGLYNVYAIATYADESKKYTDSVNVSVVSDYLKVATKGEEELLKGEVNWTEWNYDSKDDFYFCGSKGKNTASAKFTDDGKYEVSLRMRLPAADMSATISLLNEAGTADMAYPFIFETGQPFKYKNKDGEFAFNESITGAAATWYTVKMVIDTVKMTEDVYVNDEKINSEPIDIDYGVELNGIQKLKITPVNGSSTKKTMFKELTVSQLKENYNNPEIYADGQKVSDMRNVACNADTLTFDCAVWADATVKCNDADAEATYNADSKVTTVTLPALTSDTAYSVTINDKKLIDFKTAKAEVEITNFGPSDITSAAAGDIVRGNATLLNNTGKFEDFTFFLALYENKALKDIIMLDEYTDMYDAQKNISAELTLPAGFSKDNYELKFFVFDNLYNLVPLK